jgi:signal peptidase I
MRVGDILVFTNIKGYRGQPYTEGKYYRIYKIDENFIPGCVCGWIYDDTGSSVYFRDNEAEDINWTYLKKLRKQKLKKINEEN